MSEVKYPVSEADEAAQYYERQKQLKQQGQINPDYYNAGGIEAIDFIEAHSLNFNLGNVIKYITRAGLKQGEDRLTALTKAKWYLDREFLSFKREELYTMHDLILLIFAVIIIAINFHIYKLIKRQHNYTLYILNQWLDYTTRFLRGEAENAARRKTE